VVESLPRRLQSGLNVMWRLWRGANWNSSQATLLSTKLGSEDSRSPLKFLE